MRKETIQTKYKCLSPVLTPAKVRQIQEVLDQNNTDRVRELLEVISGQIRLKILYLLSKQGELTVADIADILRSQVSGISHQLKILRDYDLVTKRKKARVVLYSLSKNLPNLVTLSLEESVGR